MLSWLAANFPPGTLPLFLPLMTALIAANFLLYRYIFRRRK